MGLNSIEVKKAFAESLGESMKKVIGFMGVDISVSVAEIANSISIPRPEQGDFSSSICFSLAKAAKKSPALIAHEIASAMNSGTSKKDYMKKISEENGYINLWIDEVRYSASILESILEEKAKYGTSGIGAGIKAIIEFPSVNPNKPWHIGHLRNALLGDSISRILSANSYSIEREDYIDDLGLQMAEILWGEDKLGSQEGKKYDTMLGEAYVQINKDITEKHAESDVNAILKKMEDTESEESQKIRRISEKSVRAQYETAFAYGIYHDVLIWESDVVRKRLLKNALEFMALKKITSLRTYGKYKDCTVIASNSEKTETEESDSEDNVKVLIRSNGVATYVAKDLAFHMWKLGIIDPGFEYSKFLMQPNGQEVYTSSDKGARMNFGRADIAINIIGSAQQHPQNLLKKVFEEITGESRIIHIAYGEVSVKGGTLSGRKGGWMGTAKSYTADELLSEMEKITSQIVANGKKAEDSKVLPDVPRKVALAAIKFEFLKVDPEKKVVFEWEKALDLNSNSGPYCMYTYARASRILEKAEMAQDGFDLGPGDFSRVTRGEDFKIIKHIGAMQEIIEKACREYKPSIIAGYAMELSLMFSNFYESMPVLGGGESKNLRVAIVMAAKQALFNMLGLINIETAERM